MVVAHRVEEEEDMVEEEEEEVEEASHPVSSQTPSSRECLAG